MIDNVIVGLGPVSRGWPATEPFILGDTTLMSISPETQIERIRDAYAAFNARDIDAAVALMAQDVEWPRAFKGGTVQGPQAVGQYWSEQWSEIDPRVEPVSFHPNALGGIAVEVHQVVRDKAGAILADEHVGHCFTMKDGLIERMDLCENPGAQSDA